MTYLQILLHFTLEASSHSTARKLQASPNFQLQHTQLQEKPDYPIMDRNQNVPKDASRKGAMVRGFDTVKDIHSKKRTWKLAVRVTDLWVVTSKTNPPHIELVIMDAKGDKIQVIVPKIHFNIWNTQCKESETYIMHNFDVFDNDLQFKACDHPYKMIASIATSIRPAPLNDIPEAIFHFKDYAEILMKQCRTDLLVDVIGALNEIVYVKETGEHPKVVISLKDLSGMCLQCTLWGEYGRTFNSYHTTHPNDKAFIIVLTHARIVKSQDNFPNSVSNSWCGSKLLINEKNPQIQQFLESFPFESLPQNSSQLMTQSGRGSQFSQQDRFFNAPIKTIGQINCITEPMFCLTIAETRMFILTKDGWSYPGCTKPKCMRKVVFKDGIWKCDCGNVCEVPILRYKVEVEVVHGKDLGNFTFWDDIVCDMLGQTAAQLKQQMLEEEEDDDKVYPELLDCLLGRYMAAKVKIQPRFGSCNVYEVKEDEKTIKTILDKMDHNEHSSKLLEYSPTKTANEELHSHTPSLSGMADHDPFLVSSITPVKRTSTETELGENTSQTPGLEELSSTKVKKFIKTE